MCESPTSTQEGNVKMVEAKSQVHSVGGVAQLCIRVDLPSDNVRAIFHKYYMYIVDTHHVGGGSN